MAVRLVGAMKIRLALEGVADRIRDTAIAAGILESILRRTVPVRTGYLKSTIYTEYDVVGAYADYAGIVEERVHYGQAAIDAFLIEDYADAVVEPF